MRQRLLTFALVVGCAALFAVSAILTMAEDKKAPVITIEDKDREITYRDGDDYAELLDGVTAKDNRDGDVTDQIFVDSITAVSDGTRAIVRYAVIDKSNNVGIKTRVIDYESTGESGQDAGQTADNEDSNSDQSEAKSEEQKQEEAKKEDTASDTANTEDHGYPVFLPDLPDAEDPYNSGIGIQRDQEYNDHRGRRSRACDYKRV